MVTGCCNTSSFGLTQSLKLLKNFNLLNIEAVKNPYPDSCLKATFFHPQCGHGGQVHLYKINLASKFRISKTSGDFTKLTLDYA